MNIGMQVFYDDIFSFSLSVYLGVEAWSYHNFYFLRSYQAVFYNNFMTLHSHQ